MNIISKEYIKETPDIIELLIDEEHSIIKRINIQKNLYNKLLNNVSKLAIAAENPALQPVDKYIEVLNEFKAALELFKNNLNILNNFLNSIVIIKFEVESKSLSNKSITKFNANLLAIKDIVVSNTVKIEQTLRSALPYYNFVLADTVNTVYNETYNIAINENIPIRENVLIISEPKGLIYLPYTITELEKELQQFPKKYTSKEDVIKKNYTLPLAAFKNLSVARFREAFKLMLDKENSNVKDAFELATELMFNYNLHPAIIAACRSLDTLDIYLDYLDDNEVHLFDCFKIEFEMSPIIKKGSNTF